MSSRKVTGPTLSLRISRRQARRWAALSGACGNGAGVNRVRASGGRPGANLALLAGAQAADVDMVLGKDQERHDENDRETRPAGDRIVENDRDRSSERGERGIARGHG